LGVVTRRDRRAETDAKSVDSQAQSLMKEVEIAIEQDAP